MKFFEPRGDIEKTAHKLPHWQQGEVAIFVTFRLADSLPRELLDDWLRAREAFLAANPPPWDDITEACYHGQFSDKLDEHLDAAHGSCALRDPRLAQIVADRLQHFDGQRYDLWSYVIMSNHVHVLFTLRDGESLPDTIQGWKGVSSRLIHKTGLSALNPFWQPDDFDRLIRSPDHFSTVQAHIREIRPKHGRVSNERRSHAKAQRRKGLVLGLFCAFAALREIKIRCRVVESVLHTNGVPAKRR
jgi:REP element-mobilizing transposase RayT